MDLAGFQKTISVSFNNEALLKEALTHRSYLNEDTTWSPQHNERLEFLGDAVLELITTDYLFKTYPQYDEGRLTSVRAALVNYQNLASVARNINLEGVLKMSKGEAKDIGRAREVILANACEALLGAMYLDNGYDTTKEFVTKHVLCDAESVIENNLDKDAKSSFQELAQERFKVTPRYDVIEEYGPDHKKVFRVGVFLDTKEIAQGEGLSKQDAEIEAAKKALHALKTS